MDRLLRARRQLRLPLCVQCAPLHPAMPPCVQRSRAVHPLTRERVRTCPCGCCVITIAGTSAPQDAAGNAFPPRADCTACIPMCGARCRGILPCGHACAAAWHEGSCPPCTERVVPAQIPCLVTFAVCRARRVQWLSRARVHLHRLVPHPLLVNSWSGQN
jgi:hypothetical protein